MAGYKYNSGSSLSHSISYSLQTFLVVLAILSLPSCSNAGVKTYIRVMPCIAVATSTSGLSNVTVKFHNQNSAAWAVWKPERA